MTETTDRVAVVGAGPAGMYVIGHLLGLPRETYRTGRMSGLGRLPVEVDVIDRLATPWGLIRNGMAPDHADRKLVADQFDRLLHRPEVRFFGNLGLGVHVTVEELSAWYDAVICTVGAPDVPPLGLPGEDLAGSVAAHQVVGWYNGHPDHRSLELGLDGVRRAVILGNGNVAIDIARVLTRPVDDLAVTDIADHALTALQSSTVEEVVILGRRGHPQAAFTTAEIEQLASTPGIDVVVDDTNLSVVDMDGLAPEARRKHDLLARIAQADRRPGAKRVVLRFCASPTALSGDGRVSSVEVVDNDLVADDHGILRARASQRTSSIEAQLVVRATGHRGRRVAGLPFDDRHGIVSNTQGRVTGTPGVYVAGWIKRGATGVVGTNKWCASDTVAALFEDLAAGRRAGNTRAVDAGTVAARLRQAQPDAVSTDGWRSIDRSERAAGQAAGRPRVKLTATNDLLAASRQRPSGSERSGLPRWDVVVVGSGLGGLSAAACLAASGKSVLVLEQHDIVGGCSQVFRRNGNYEFDCGVHYVGGCVPGSDGLIPTVLRGLGVEDRIEWSRLDDDGMDTVTLPEHVFRVPTSWDGWAQNLREAFPADADGITRAVNELRRIGEGADRINDTPHSVSAVLPLLKRPVEAAAILRGLEQPIGALFDRCGLSPEARAGMQYLGFAHNTPPSRTPALLVAVLLRHYFKAGAYFPRHGGQVISANLTEVIEAHGGTVLTRQRVTSIDVDAGKVTGVTLDDGRAIRADVVVSNADAHRTYLDLVGVNHLPARMHRRIRRFRRGHSIFSTYLAADIDLSRTWPATNFISLDRYDLQTTYDLMDQGRWDPKSWLAISSPTLKTYGQHAYNRPGHSTIEAFAPVPGDHEFWGGGDPTQGPGYRDSAKYQDRKQEIEDNIVRRTLELLPELDGHLVWKESGTPLTHERYTLSRMPYGPENAKDQIGPFRRLSATTAIKGLYLAGASTSYMYGIAFTLRGGVGTASHVLGHDLMADFHHGRSLVNPANLPTHRSDWDPFEASRRRSADPQTARTPTPARTLLTSDAS